MRNHRVTLGLVCLAAMAAAAGCASKQEVKVLRARVDSLDSYITDKLHPWLKKVGDAVCNIEVDKNVTNATTTPRLCPSGKGGGGDQSNPPPPKP